MADVRTLLAIALGVILGTVALAFPRTLIRIQTAGTRPDRQGGYGQGGTVSDLAVLVVRVLGGIALVVVAVLALQTF